MKRAQAVGFTVKVVDAIGLTLRVEEFKTFAEAMDRYNLINGKCEMAFAEGRRIESAEAPLPKYK